MTGANANFPLLLSLISSLGFEDLARNLATSVAGNGLGETPITVSVYDIAIYSPGVLVSLKDRIAFSPLSAQIKAEALTCAEAIFVGAVTPTEAGPGIVTLDYSYRGKETCKAIFQPPIGPGAGTHLEVILDAITGLTSGVNLNGSLFLLKY